MPDACVPILSRLLKADLAEREVRSIACPAVHVYMHARGLSQEVRTLPGLQGSLGLRLRHQRDQRGHCPAVAPLRGHGRGAKRRPDRWPWQTNALHSARSSGPGTGKTHVATAIGIQAIEHHRQKVRFFSTIGLVNALAQEKAKGKAKAKTGRIAEGLTRLDLVISDDLGYLAGGASGGALLFHLPSKLYERTSVVITTNLSFSEWAGVFGDARMTPALLDRLARPPCPTALLDRCARQCPRTNGGQWLALETGNDSFRFKARSAAARKKKAATHALTPA